MGRIKLFSGSAHPSLSNLVATRLGTELAPITTEKFANGETNVQLQVSVREEDIYIIQSCAGDVNDNFMQLCIIISACAIGSAKKIHAILPYFPYTKYSKMKKKRMAITARLCAQMLKVSGVHHVVTMDLHADQIPGFFDCPVDNMYAAPLLVKYIRENFIAEQSTRSVVVVGKNAGAAKRVSTVAELLSTNFSVIHKEKLDNPDARGEDDESYQEQIKVLTLVGDVKDKTAVLVDDMIDNCSSFIDAARLCKEHGARRIAVVVTHGILSEITEGSSSLKQLVDSDIDEIVVTNTTPQDEHQDLLGDMLTVIDISPILAETIRRVHHSESISYLFKNVPTF